MSPLFARLDAISGLLWAATYVLILRRSWLDKTSAVPLASLSAGIAWEIIWGVLQPTKLPAFVVPLWLAIDAGIVYQRLRYGPRSAWFVLGTAAAIACAFAIERTFIADWGDDDGVYSGYAVNVVMSFAFVGMAAGRRDVRGQSMYIALSKLAGSAIAVPHSLALHPFASLRVLIATALLADALYAVLLHRRLTAEGTRPWARV